MKKLFIILTLVFSQFFQLSAQKEKLNQIFDKYQETEGVTSIKIAKPMFSMLSNLNIADAELNQIKPLLTKINGIKILVIEKPENKTSSALQTSLVPKIQSDITAALKDLNYDELMTVNSKENKIKFLSGEAKNGILNDLLLSINADDNTVLMMLDGQISMNDVNKLMNQVQVTANSKTKEPAGTRGEVITQVRNVGPFAGISASSGIKVNFTQGTRQTVVVEADGDLQQYVQTEVKDGILVLGIRKANNKNLQFKKLQVTIEAPHLKSVDLSSGAQFYTANEVSETDFTGNISSGANFNADLNISNHSNVSTTSGSSSRVNIKTKSLDITSTSGASLTLTGKASSASFDISSASSVNAQDLQAQSLTAEASSGASLKIHATQNLKANAGSGASIRYRAANLSKNDIRQTSGGSVKSF